MSAEESTGGYEHGAMDELRAAIEEARDRRMEDIISPDFLEMLAAATREGNSPGFRYVEDPSIPPGNVGFTNLKTRQIHYNPMMIRGSLEHRIKPLSRYALRGFFLHEAGHHTPAVTAFQDLLYAYMQNPDIIPSAYRGSPQAEERFLGALHSHLHNSLFDVWLEQYLGRGRYRLVKQDIQSLYDEIGEPSSYLQRPRPIQLQQLIVGLPHFKLEDLEHKLDPDVYEAYQRMRDSKALETLMDTKAFENFFASPAEREAAIQRKFNAYKEVFLPEYLRLIELELEERKKERQKQKEENQNKEEGDQGEEGEGEENKQKQGANEQGKQQGQQKGQQRQSEGAPLTAEEEEEIREQLLRELTEAGSPAPSQAAAPEEDEKREQAMREIRKQIEERNQGEQPKTPPPEASPKGAEALREIADKLAEEDAQRRQKGLADAMKVRERSVKQWNEVKERYKNEIAATASVLAEIFLDDRRKRLEFLKHEGEIVPGLEMETITALLGGELDPDTHMETVQNPEFLETEIEFIVDRSGSMSGQKIIKSVETMVIITEAFKQVRELLSAEDLLLDNEEPFRVGVTAFETSATRITPLTEPLSDQKELKIIDQCSQVGGGTDEQEALQGVYNELTLKTDNVIKIVVVLSDGVGNPAAVAPIMQQVEADNKVLFLVVALGDSRNSADAISRTYLSPLTGRNQNVFAITTDNPDQALPGTLEFLKREVANRRPY